MEKEVEAEEVGRKGKGRERKGKEGKGREKKEGKGGGRVSERGRYSQAGTLARRSIPLKKLLLPQVLSISISPPFRFFPDAWRCSPIQHVSSTSEHILNHWTSFG